MTSHIITRITNSSKHLASSIRTSMTSQILNHMTNSSKHLTTTSKKASMTSQILTEMKSSSTFSAIRSRMTTSTTGIHELATFTTFIKATLTSQITSRKTNDIEFQTNSTKMNWISLSLESSTTKSLQPLKISSIFNSMSTQHTSKMVKTSISGKNSFPDKLSTFTTR